MRALARDIARPWPGLQLPEGTFPDYLHGDLPPRSTRYGEAVLGYGLMLTGLRERDDAMIDSGLHALAWFIRRRDLQRAHESVFATAFVASAYNVARRRLGDHPRFAPDRPRWERWLGRAHLLWLPDTRHYGNKYVVEVVGVLELLRSGVEAPAAGGILADRDRSRRRAERLINLRVPRMGDRERFRAGGEDAFLLSDPDAGSPLAYLGLSLGMYARAVELLGAHARTAAHRTLRRVAEAAWAVQAPDGDLAYVGRSQEQAWALALTAYGALAAAALDPSRAGRLRPVAARALRRLERMHGSGPKGLFITPSLRPDYRGRKGLDSYAAAIGYTGLTLAALNWTIDRFGDEVPTPGDEDEPPTRGHVVRAANRRNTLAVGRAPRRWFAVRSAASARAEDLRYDFGLVALKVAVAGDGWQDVLPVRPKTRHGPDSAGPLLRRSRGLGLPEAERIDVADDGTLTLHGGWRTASGRWLRRGVRFRFEPVDDGVRLIFPTEPGDRVKYGAFFCDRGRRPTIEGQRIFDDEQLLTFDPPAEAAIDAQAYASGRDAQLIRVNLLFPERGGGAIRITTRRR